jgi:uncharacterized protein (TIGR02145 family)
MKKYIPVLFALLSLTIISYHAVSDPFFEGTKQLQPDTTYPCSLNVTSGGAPWYYCFANQACPNNQKLWVRVGSPSEKVYLGFGNMVTFRINYNGSVVFGPTTVTPLTKGYIKYYKQAIAGPSVLGTGGYNAVEFYPGTAGDYSIDINVTNIGKVDITVIDTLNTPFTAIDGRLWSQDWAFITGSITIPTDAFRATQYIYSDDSVVTSIYYNLMQGDVFDVTSTSNGCYPPPMPFQSSCESRTGNHHYPQYKIFLNDPDSLQFPTGSLGNIITGDINVTQQCDGSFTFNFWVNKPGSVQLDIEVNPAPGHQPEDVTIIDTVVAGSNTIVWNGLDGLGVPVPTGNTVIFSMTYINGLTNIALFDVERQVDGFIITLVRPQGPPIATYWNDTLLASKGGTTNFTGCFGSYPTNGCHRWTGYYNGQGIGSENTVNTWWYAASSASSIGTYTMARGPATPSDISGPTQFCQTTNAVYTIVPNPLPGADPYMYEWVLTDVATGTPLFDLTNQDVSITINFSLYPPGDKKLKVRGYKASCGNGPFGPGTDGILISTAVATQITNTTRTFNMCSGSTTDIVFQTSLVPATFNYTAHATSPLVTGFSGGTINPLQQTLSTSGITSDSVIYKVVPYTSPCYGDTAKFYVIIHPYPQVTNTVTTFTQCSETSTNIGLLSNVGGGTFYWTASASSPDVSGFSAGTGIVIEQPLINSGASPQTVTYTVRDSLNGCIGPAKDFIVTVTPKSNASISISVSLNPFCLLIPVSFTSSIINGGSLPQYVWQVNGVNTGNTLPTFTYIPTDGDVVLCILTSNASCIQTNTVNSNSIVMVLNTNFPAGVFITASNNPFCTGSTVTYTAGPINGGTLPVYQWKVNGINKGTNSPGYTYQPLPGDVINCSMTSNLNCVTGSPVNSNSVTMTAFPNPVVTFIPCIDTITAVNAKPLKLKGGLPLGGTYSGAGVNSSTGIFDPSLAGPGTHTVVYSYTNVSLCSGTASVHIVTLPSSGFTCGSLLSDIRDNKTYPTVQLGSQCWMASNLNYGTGILSAQDQRDNCITEKYCYGDNPANCTSLGGLYQWDELMLFAETAASQGLCPPGWHIPTEDEWNTLFNNYTNFGFAASPLKYSGYSGFNAVLSGTRHVNTGWDFPGFATFFWSSTLYNSTKAWAHGMNDPDPSVSLYPSLRVNAFSVRCLKD